MGCVSSTSVLLGLLLSLATLSDSTVVADAHHLVGITVINEKSMGEQKRLGKESLPIAKTRIKWLRGRKMGAVNVERNVEDAKSSSNSVSNMKTEKGGKEELKIVGELSGRGVLTPRVKLIGAGKSSNSLKKPGSSSTKYMPDKEKTYRNNIKLIMSGPSSAMAVKPRKQTDAATEMFSMLSRDYSWAQRRPPVNDDAPFHDKP